ncbi:MAG TPA: methyltransferase domain-containing protein, partial [Solirubrobacteraceae bacterium]|nr:methyltransferase domain-containing protein [Solirubrobacteraceae bacterium]
QLDTTAAEPPDAALRREYLLANVGAGESVVDLGCGAGDFTAALARAGVRATGIDVAEAALRHARERHAGLELDFALAPVDGPLPLGDASVDVVWASEVIEHVADTARWLSEVRRVLRPGGRLLLTTPYHGRVRNVWVALTGFEAHYDPRSDHLRFYTRSSLQALLEDFGFGELRLRAAGGPPLLRRLLLASAVRGRW